MAKGQARDKSCRSARDEILRPRTAYNFFYKYQRDLILKSKALSTSNHGDIKEINLYVDSFSCTSKRKRPHRKTHGLIGLQQLTKTVAKRWKEADTETRNKFIALAAQDKIRYKNESLTRSAVWMKPFNAVGSHSTIHQQHTPNFLLQVENPHCNLEQNPHLHKIEMYQHDMRTQTPVRYPPMVSPCNHIIDFPQSPPIFEPVAYNSPLIGKRQIRHPSNDYANVNRTVSPDNTLSAEEYEMLDLLIRE